MEGTDPELLLLTKVPYAASALPFPPIPDLSIGPEQTSVMELGAFQLG